MSQNSSSTREKEKAKGGPEHVVINLNVEPKKSDSFRKVFSQIQKLTEDNKKIALLED